MQVARLKREISSFPLSPQLFVLYNRSIPMSVEKLTQNLSSGLSQAAESFSNTAQQTFDSARGTVDAMGDVKIADLQRDTKDVNSGVKQTTDFGCPVSDLDNTLKIVNKDRIGPQLLEDHVARERVRLVALDCFATQY